MSLGFHSRQLTHKSRRSSSRVHRWRLKLPAWRQVQAAFGRLRTLKFKGSKSPLHIALIVLAVGGAATIGFLAYIWLTLPDVSNPQSLLASQSTIITDRHGIELYRLFQEEDRTFIAGEQIPEALKQGIVAIEDQRFHQRGCLDVRAIARAVFRLGRAGGASTITRQLARTALDLKRENRYIRKIKELVLGCQLEARLSKDELLELYLNWIPFGQRAYGVEQASQTYFGVSAAELSLAQSAVLAALPQRPTYFSPYGSQRHTKVSSEIDAQIAEGVITKLSDIPAGEIRIGLLGATTGTGAHTLYIGGRTDQVLRNMQDQGLITEQSRLAALSELEQMSFQPSRETIRAPHFVLWIRQQVEDMFAGTAEEGLLERGGLHVQTTLDWELQQHAEAAVEFHREDVISRFGAQNLALLAVDPKQREILAYVGNADFHDEDYGGKIDMVHAPRQPGSSFKPLVYAAAFERGYNPATILFDVPTEIGGDEPQNFDGQFFGPLTIRQSLGASRNIPAAKAFFLAGGEEVILRLASNLGATTPFTRREQLNQERAEGFGYGWPLALGAAETPLMEMVQAYSTFAAGGVRKPIVSIQRISDKHGNILFAQEPDEEGVRVLDERIAYQVTSVLSDESARPDEYWRTQLTVSGFQTAAKTGTSNKCLETNDDGSCRLRKPDNAWLLGYTPQLVTGVWAGNADSSAMFDKAGGLNTASPVWNDFMARAHRQLDVQRTSFDPPEGILQPQVSLLSGQLPTVCTPVELRRADVFLQENAPVEPDPACLQLTVDRVTGLLASDTCPEDAREDGSFYSAHSVLPERFPKWEEAVQAWMDEQMELWTATPDHSGSLLKLPKAPTEYCDPALTPGRLDQPELRILSPTNGGVAAYPAFAPRIDYGVGSSVREVRYRLDGKRVAVETEPPYQPMIRVPRSISKEGLHTLEVTLEDEYFNQVTDSVQLRFGKDERPPTVRLLEPEDQAIVPVGSEILLRATADDAEGGIKYVQFFLDGTLLSTKPRDPFELTYTLDVEPGVHTIRAVAEDLAKQRSEDTVRITVTEE